MEYVYSKVAFVEVAMQLAMIEPVFMQKFKILLSISKRESKEELIPRRNVKETVISASYKNINFLNKYMLARVYSISINSRLIIFKKIYEKTTNAIVNTIKVTILFSSLVIR